MVRVKVEGKHLIVMYRTDILTNIYDKDRL